MGKFANFLKQHAIDNTISLASTFPIFASLEMLVLGMSAEVSMMSKLWGSAFSYGGVGIAFVRGRDISRRLFRITPESKEWKKGLHDYLYAAAFNAVVCPVVYKASGANWEDTLKGTGMVMGLSCVSGPIAGYAVDAGRDLTGVVPPSVPPPERLPGYVRTLPARVKQGLYAAAIAACLGLTGLVYALTPEKKSAAAPAPLEQRVEQHYQK